MKRLITLTLVALALNVAVAQEKSNLRWGAEVGIGVSNWALPDGDAVGPKFSYRLGIGLDVPFKCQWMEVHTGLSFVSKGGKSKEYQGNKIDINQLYLQVPAVLVCRIPTLRNFDVMAGLGFYAAYGVGGKTKVRENWVTTTGSSFSDGGLNRFDAGLQTSLGLDFSEFYLNLNLERGFINMIEGATTQNISLSFSIGRKF